MNNIFEVMQKINDLTAEILNNHNNKSNDETNNNDNKTDNNDDNNDNNDNNDDNKTDNNNDNKTDNNDNNSDDETDNEPDNSDDEIDNEPDNSDDEIDNEPDNSDDEIDNEPKNNDNKINNEPDNSDDEIDININNTNTTDESDNSTNAIKLATNYTNIITELLNEVLLKQSYAFNCCLMLDNYNEAIKLGNNIASYELGLFYMEWNDESNETNNFDVIINNIINPNNWSDTKKKFYNIGKKYLLKSAEHGNPNAYSELAVSAFNSNEDIINYYFKAIELNDVSSMTNLGKVYLCLGKIDEMKKMYEMAISLFDINAIVILSEYYYKVEKNLEKSRELDKLLLKFCLYEENYRCEFVYEKFKPIELFVFLNELVDEGFNDGNNVHINYIITEKIKNLRNTPEINNYYNKISFAKKFNIISECIICYNECLVLCFNCAHLCCQTCYSKVSVCPLCRI